MFKVHQRANTALLFHLLLLQIPPNIGARFAEALLNHQFYLSFLRVSQLEMLSPLATRASLDVIHLLIRVSLLSTLNYPPTTHPRFYHWGAFLNICGELASGISAALSHGNRSSPPIAR